MKAEEEKKHISEEEFLKNYDPSEFERPSVTVDNVILSIFETKTGNYRKNPEQNLYLLLNGTIHPQFLNSGSCELIKRLFI